MNRPRTRRAASGCLRNALGAALLLGSLPAAADLIGVGTRVKTTLPVIEISQTGRLSFSVATGALSVDSEPLNMFLRRADGTLSGTMIGPHNGSKAFDIRFTVDASGAPTSGGGRDLVVSGAVDLDGDGTVDKSGELLTGTVEQFGYRDAGNDAFFDYLFRVTGGQLQEVFGSDWVGVVNNSEVSSFQGNFGADFAGNSKGTLAALETQPAIGLCTLVTLNDDRLSDFSDADDINDATCSGFAQGIPVGLIGKANATYRFFIRNTGTENLTGLAIDAEALGLANAAVPASCTVLPPGGTCEIRYDAGNLDYAKLYRGNVCAASGDVDVLARVRARGQQSDLPVADDDPATVRCVGEPAIAIEKLVRTPLTGGKRSWQEADDQEAAAPARIGQWARYLLRVTNTGTETLTGLVINDAALGITNVPLSGNLAPGQEAVVNPTSTGFAALYVGNRCPEAGFKFNEASVTARGVGSSTPVAANDPAWVRCEDPQIVLKKQVGRSADAYVDADPPDSLAMRVGESAAFYRLLVTNTGSETLQNVTVTDSALGLQAVPIPDLAPGEERVLTYQAAGFAALRLANPCPSAGVLDNVASVGARGAITGANVQSQDPASVTCYNGPAIELEKDVRLPEGTTDFVAADTPDAAPLAALGGDATFRFRVTNRGDETLTSVKVRDDVLGIADTDIGNLASGESRTILSTTAGFGRLAATGYCDAVGNKLNTAQVRGQGVQTGGTVEDANPAYVRCDSPGCSLEVDATCQVDPPETGMGMCTDSISATTLRYTGPSIANATVSFAGKDGGSVTYTGVQLVKDVTILTSADQAGYTVAAAVGSKLGSATSIKINGKEEIIHTSCSAIYEAGKPAPLDAKTPNPPNSEKGAPSPNWTVVAFRQKDGVVVEAPGPTEPSRACSVPLGGGNVNYAYRVRNSGSTTATVTSLEDSVYGSLLDTPRTLAPDETVTIEKMFYAFSAQTQQVAASGTVAGAGKTCAATASVDIDVAPGESQSCDDGKPRTLVFEYTGQGCAGSNTQEGKFECNGTPNSGLPAALSVSDGTVAPAGQVLLPGDYVRVDASGDKFSADTDFTIRQNGVATQSMTIHTSCSKRFEVGDRFGSLVLRAMFVDDSGGKKGKKGKKGK